MFTFAIITYNHEKHIVEHLESIKYQIANFGQEETFSLIVSDDASNDKTICLIEKWLEQNQYLFHDVKILKSVNNQGITKNYVRAVISVASDNFKVSKTRLKVLLVRLPTLKLTTVLESFSKA